MANSANTFTSLMPMLKESYASGSMKTHEKPGSLESPYAAKMKRIMEKPGSSKQYFSHIKKYIKKAKKK